MKSRLFSCVVLGLISSISFADTSLGGGVGSVTSYITCSGTLVDGTNASFEVRPTAASAIIDSVLLNSDTNELFAHLYCQKGTEIAPGVPSAGAIKWVCGQTDLDQNTGGGMSVTIMRGGFTGVTTAQIEEKQMFPLPASQLGTLICK